MLTFNLVLGRALSVRIAPSLALNLQEQEFSPLTFPPEDQPVFCLTLSLCSSHRLAIILLSNPPKKGNLQQLTWMFVLGRAASVRPPSFALYLVKAKVGIIGVLSLK